MAATFVFCALSPSAVLGEQVVAERGGDIYLRTATGWRQMTNTGSDAAPKVSPSGKNVVFIRKLRESVLSTENVLGWPDKTQLWVVATEASSRPELLLGTPIDLKGSKYYRFTDPQWSADGTAVFFSVDYAVTTGAIARVSLIDRRAVFIAPAIEFHVVQTGKYAGYLVAQQRKYKLAGGHYDWYWLLDPDGAPVDVIGESETEVEEFCQSYSATLSR